MAITERYVTVLGAGDHNGTSEAHAYTWAEMVTAIAGGASAGYRYNIKSGTYSISSSSTISGNGTSAAPLILRGYNSTIGDLTPSRGGTYSNGALTTTNYPVISCSGASVYVRVSSAYAILQSLSFTGNRSADNLGTLYLYGNYASMYGCAFANTANSSNAVACNAYSYGAFIFNCDFACSGTSSYCALYAQAWTRIVGCRFTDSASHAILGGHIHVIAFCVFLDAIDGDCIRLDSTDTSSILPTIVCNTSYGCGGDFVSVGNRAYTYYPIVLGNHVTDAAGYLCDSDYNGTANLAVLAAYNRTRNLTGGLSRGFTDWIAAACWGDVTTPSDYETDYQDAPNGDLNLGIEAPGISNSFLKWLDIGALQQKPGTVPDDDDVLDGVTYGVYDEGLGVVVLPDAANVAEGVTYGPNSETEGTLAGPAAGDLRDGVTWGATEGTLELPDVADVRDGTGYGEDGTEYEGELIVAAAASSADSTDICPSGLFIHTCDVYRPTTSADGSHAPTRTYALQLSAIPCRIQPRRAAEPTTDGRIATTTAYAVYTGSQHEIVSTDRLYADSRWLEVTGVVHFDFKGYVRLDCEEVG